MVFDLLTPVQGKFCRHRVSRAPEMMITAAAARRTCAARQGGGGSGGCMHARDPNWSKLVKMVTNLHTHNQVHELIFSLSFYVNFAVHLARLMALRKHTQTYQLRYALLPTPPGAPVAAGEKTEHLVFSCPILLIVRNFQFSFWIVARQNIFFH